jgi:hypothetical protein
MFGLMVFGAAALYLALMLFVMRWAWRKARANGGSVLKATLFALLGFLLVYLPVFWNYIPVLLAHRSMCEKDAGFNAYVTPDQWVSQHQETIDKLRKEEVEQQERNSKSELGPDGFQREVYFGGLLVTEWRNTKQKVLNLEVGRSEQRIRDSQTNTVLATYINYTANKWDPDNPIGWIFPSSCFDDNDKENPKYQYWGFSNFNSYLKE